MSIALPEQTPTCWLRALAGMVRPSLTINLLAGWGGALLFMAAAWLLADLIHAAFIEHRDRAELLTSLVAIAALLIGRGLLSWLRSESGFYTGSRVRAHLRRQLLSALGGMDREQRAGLSGAALSSQVLEQVEALDGYFARYLPQRFLAVLIPLSILAAVFPLNWAAGLILLLTAPLIPLFMALVGMGAAALNQRNFQVLARLSRQYQDRLRGLPALRRFGLTETAEQEISEAAESFRKRTMEVLRVAFLSSAVLEFFAALAIALVAVYLGMSYLGYLDFGHYGDPITLRLGLFILLLAPEFYLPLRELGTCYHDRAAAIGAAEELMPMLRGNPASSSTGTRSLEGPVTIRFSDLHYRYPGMDRNALTGLDLRIAPGERVAVVGASGSGKSTLVALLLGQLQPSSGQLLLNEQPMESCSPEQWQGRLGWLGQSPYLFHASLGENLRLANPQASDAALRMALANVGLLDQLPDGLATPLGEQGHGLSGGQLRRVALARAMLKRPSLLLLDEPTAALDGGSETEVIRYLDRLPPETGMLILTHRPATLALADRILVLEDGHLVAEGRSVELSDPNAPITRRLIREGMITEDANDA